MKQIYISILLLLVCQLGIAGEKNKLFAPSATIDGTTTVCQNATSPVITFTGSGGTAPYTFTYTVTGTTGNQTIQTTSGNSVTLAVPTGTDGTFIYTLVSVSDSTLPVMDQAQTGTAIITITPQPDVTINGTGQGTFFGGIPVFRICNNAVSTFTFINASSTSSTINSNYTIVWGDGTPNFSSTSWSTSTPLPHDYQVGLWNMSYTIQSSNGCSITKNYIVFVGSNPAVSLGNPGNTDICSPSPLTFPITGTANNPPGTTYTVTFSDSSPAQTFTHPPPASVTHTFAFSSCGFSASNGVTTFQNSFSANIVAENPCGSSAIGVVPIYVSKPPVANFSLPTKGCTNTPICVTNTSTGAYENNGSNTNCNTSPKFVWSITPATGFTISPGSLLGNDVGSPDPNLWITGTSPLCINFTEAGTYTITIIIGNRCDNDQKTKTICIEPPLVPQFILDNNTGGCIPLTVTASDTTSLVNQCETPTYLWSIAYASDNCSSNSAFTYASGTSETSVNPSFNFTDAGTYSISETMTNSCGAFTSAIQTVVVKKPPTVDINPISNSCGITDINPTAIINSCAPASSTLSYAWSFPGGTPSSSTNIDPGTISYPAGGPYNVSLIVSNECGNSLPATKTFSVNTAAVTTVTSEPLATQTVCQNSPATILSVIASGGIIGTTYYYQWYSSTSTSTASGTLLVGETNSNYNPPTNTVGTLYYYCIITQLAGSGCNATSAVAAVTVTATPSINPNVVLTNNACFGVNTASITTNITGGIPFSSGSPYQLSWTGPSSFTSSATSISNIQPGTYNVSIVDAGGCPFSNSYTITEPADIVITVDSENDIKCYNSNNGSINISVTGGTGAYSYRWTKNTAPFAITEDISNLAPGTYEVSVTDVNNCGPKTTSFTITEPPLLVVSLVSQTNVLCYGASTGAITVNVTGGTPGAGYNFSWIGPNGFTSTNQNLTGILAGNYDLTVTDANACIKNLSVIITQSTEIIIAYTTTPITCYGNNDASMTVTLSGGNPNLDFQWSNLSTSLTQTNLSAGNYVIIVTDNVGCVKTETIVIAEAPIFTINPIVTQISCNGANNGSINLNLTGGIDPVLTWSDGSSAGLVRNNLAPGTYTATISDGTGCGFVRTFTIIQPLPLVLSANLTNAFDCSNASSGAINLVVAGGTLPYTYSWSNGVTTEDLSNLTSGNYLVIVTDANGCTANAQYQIIRPEPIVINVATQTDFDCAAHTVNQQFVAQIAGGIPPYELQWSSGTISGANDEIMQTNVNGTVILTVSDDIGCQSNYTVNVDTPVLGYASFNQSSFGFTTYGLYAIGDPIQFQSNITGDYLSVSWDFGDGTFSTELNPIHTYLIPKDYIVTQTVTYPFGCVYVQTISLFVEEGYLLVVPTAFTPNNDNINDTMRPVTRRLKNVKMDIYDTWGSLVYTEKGDELVGWDGKIKGFNAENGNYYSKVTAETFYGTIVYYNQTFVLIK